MMITQKDIDIFWEEFAKDKEYCCKGDQQASPEARPTKDAVNHPPHYTSHPSGIEAIQITEHMSFLMGNAMKYLWRADLKNGVEDLQKAIFYINREIKNRLDGNTA